jgi:hypothetical protein
MLVPVAAPAPIETSYPFGATPLVVAFAAIDRLDGVRSGARVPLATRVDVSPEDGYVLFPARALEALESAFALGQVGRLRAWFDEAIVVEGRPEATRRGVRLEVDVAWSVREVLAAASPTVVSLRGVGDPVRVANRLGAVAQLAPSGLFDAESAEWLASGREYAGISRADLLEPTNPGHPPTFVWVAPDARGVMQVRAALCAEDGSATLLVAPVAFAR